MSEHSSSCNRELQSKLTSAKELIDECEKALGSGQEIVFEGTPHDAIPISVIYEALSLIQKWKGQ